jgi:hypothetical protein
MSDKHNLRNINIENLFSTEQSIPHTNGKLDINTLFASKARKDFTVDPKILLNGGIKRKRTLEECYINIYKACWETIVQADKSGITDIIFEVPEPISCIGYSSTECLNIIEKNLMAVSNNGIKCNPLNDKRIFITWHGIENVL